MPSPAAATPLALSQQQWQLALTFDRHERPLVTPKRVAPTTPLAFTRGARTTPSTSTSARRRPQHTPTQHGHLLVQTPALTLAALQSPVAHLPLQAAPSPSPSWTQTPFSPSFHFSSQLLRPLCNNEPSSLSTRRVDSSVASSLPSRGLSSTTVPSGDVDISHADALALLRTLQRLDPHGDHAFIHQLAAHCKEATRTFLVQDLNRDDQPSRQPQERFISNVDMGDDSDDEVVPQTQAPPLRSWSQEYSSGEQVGDVTAELDYTSPTQHTPVRRSSALTPTFDQSLVLSPGPALPGSPFVNPFAKRGRFSLPPEEEDGEEADAQQPAASVSASLADAHQLERQFDDMFVSTTPSRVVSKHAAVTQPSSSEDASQSMSPRTAADDATHGQMVPSQHDPNWLLRAASDSLDPAEQVSSRSAPSSSSLLDKDMPQTMDHARSHSAAAAPLTPVYNEVEGVEDEESQEEFDQADDLERPQSAFERAKEYGRALAAARSPGANISPRRSQPVAFNFAAASNSFSQPPEDRSPSRPSSRRRTLTPPSATHAPLPLRRGAGLPAPSSPARNAAFATSALAFTPPIGGSDSQMDVATPWQPSPPQTQCTPVHSRGHSPEAAAAAAEGHRRDSPDDSQTPPLTQLDTCDSFNDEPMSTSRLILTYKESQEESEALGLEQPRFDDGDDDAYDHTPSMPLPSLSPPRDLEPAQSPRRFRSSSALSDSTDSSFVSDTAAHLHSIMSTSPKAIRSDDVTRRIDADQAEEELGLENDLYGELTEQYEDLVAVASPIKSPRAQRRETQLQDLASYAPPTVTQVIPQPRLKPFQAALLARGASKAAGTEVAQPSGVATPGVPWRKSKVQAQNTSSGSSSGSVISVTSPPRGRTRTRTSSRPLSPSAARTLALAVAVADAESSFSSSPVEIVKSRSPRYDHVQSVVREVLRARSPAAQPVAAAAPEPTRSRVRSRVEVAENVTLPQPFLDARRPSAIQPLALTAYRHAPHSLVSPPPPSKRGKPA